MEDVAAGYPDPGLDVRRPQHLDVLDGFGQVRRVLGEGLNDVRPDTGPLLPPPPPVQIIGRVLA